MIKVCIIGTGQIGFDLLHKLIKLDFVEVVAFVGRRDSTKIPNNVYYSNKSIEYFIENPKCCEVVFDCTDAYSAVINNKVFAEQGIKVIDLTPSDIGEQYIPNLSSLTSNNINMVTCGGQVCLPLLKYLYDKVTLKTNCSITYIEVVTQINTESAGMATRINIDKYVETTETAIYKFINVPKCKVILNVNPNIYSNMKTTIYLKINNTENIIEEQLDFSDVDNFILSIKEYIPNYSTTKPTWLTNDTLMTHVKVIGSSEIISNYHGNLDIINCASIHALKQLTTNG
jgi:acetaldehyde dehydrogenase